MKILFVHDHYGAFGGAEANIHLTASELKRRGHTLGIVHGPTTGKAEAAWNNLFSYSIALDPSDSAASTQMALRQFEPDLAYVHKMADLRVLESVVASAVPHIRMVHDHDMYCMRSYKYSYLTRKPCTRAASAYCVFPCGASLARNREGALPIRWVSYRDKKKEIALNKRFHRMIVYSQHTREELINNGFDARKIDVQVAVRGRENSTRRSSFSERNLIVFAGQIIRGKGVDVLLKALAKVQSPFECAILGDGSHRAKCERLAAKLNLTGRVRFHGYVPPARFEEFYLDASVFVMSSLWPEPFGMAGPEAMHYGLPVVAFNSGGIKEWLIDRFNGYLVPWMDTQAFAARIDDLLANKTLARQMGENGFQFVNRQFDITNYVDRLEEIFSLVIGENKVATNPKPIYAAVTALPETTLDFAAPSTWKMPTISEPTTRRMAI